MSRYPTAILTLAFMILLMIWIRRNSAMLAPAPVTAPAAGYRLVPTRGEPPPLLEPDGRGGWRVAPNQPAPMPQPEGVDVAPPTRVPVLPLPPGYEATPWGGVRRR